MVRWLALMAGLGSVALPGVLVGNHARAAVAADTVLSGFVFVDYDRDGRVDPGERGVAAVADLTVSVVGADGVSVGGPTDSDGAFDLDLGELAGTKVRIDFETPAGHLPTFAQPFGMSRPESGTATRFVDLAAPVGDIVYGIVPDSSCPDDPAGVGGPSSAASTGNPNSLLGKVWTACFVDGPRTGAFGAQDVLVGANYDATGWSPSNVDTGLGGNVHAEHIGTLDQLGSVWGVAYDEWHGVLYTSAVVKRHAQLGSEGIDGLYWFDVGADGTDRTAMSIGLDSLSPPDAPSFGADPPSCPVTPNGNAYDYDSFSTAATGPGGRWDCRDVGLSVGGEANYDWWAFDRTGRAGIGDIDVTPDGNLLLVMNATADAVFVYDTTAGEPIYQRHLPITDPGCRGGGFEAWATTAIDAASAYVGVTCTASDSGLADDLSGHVVELDLTSGNQAVVADVGFVYTHGPGWSAQPGPHGGDFQPWLALQGEEQVPAFPPVEEAAGIVYLDFLDAYGYANGWDHHQPLLSDIEVDPFDGSLVLAVMDRWSMMTGVFNCDLDPTTNGCGYELPAPPPGDYDGVGGDDPVAGYTSGIIGYVAGDLLRVCNTGDNVDEPVFVLEGGVGCDPAEFSPAFEPPYGGGPAGATEWYWNDQAFANVQTENAHPEAAQGAVYIADRRDEVVYTAMNPIETFGAGLSWDSNRDGAHDNGFQFYRTDLENRDGTAFKSAGLGDVEGCSIPLEIGNHVWFDENVNGRRDPDESPIAGIRVDLLDAESAAVIATTITDDEGNYYFGTAQGLRARTNYMLGFGLSDDTNTDGLGVSPKDLRETIVDPTIGDDLDSDVVDGRIRFRTGDPGENDHTLDAGFGPAEALPDAAGLADLDAGDDGGVSTWTIVGFALLSVLIGGALVISLRWSWNRE